MGGWPLSRDKYIRLAETLLKLVLMSHGPRTRIDNDYETDYFVRYP
jgi:hypothetical protein